MNKTLLLLGAIALFSATTLLMRSHSEHHESEEQIASLWKNFKTTHNKKYSSAQQEMYRIQVFKNNLAFIRENQGDTYTLGINSLSDITPEEFRATYLGFRPDLMEETEEIKAIEQVDAVGANPASVNWVDAGVVPPILNQGQCGSCWAFSAAGSISLAYNVQNQNNQLQLSPEQLVQCSSSYGNNGCNGGLMDNAFRYAQKYPLATLAQYPYTSGTGVTGSCNTTLQAQGKYPVKSYTNIPKANTGALQTAIVQQPVSVAVDASQWQHYTNGVFSKCGTKLDHGVIAVGYTPTYWLIRNSWGTGWGQQGYIELALGDTCGLANSASYPTV